MPKKEINLLPRDDFEKKPIGKFLVWTLNVGRWVVILTELIVIMAFLSRFKLDRDLNDLEDNIRQKETVISAYSGFEREFRLFQKRLALLDQLEKTKLEPTNLVNKISQYISNDVVLKNLAIDQNGVKVMGEAYSESGLGNFYQLLKKDKEFKNVSLANISKNEEQTALQFTINFETIKGVKNAN